MSFVFTFSEGGVSLHCNQIFLFFYIFQRKNMKNVKIFQLFQKILEFMKKVGVDFARVEGTFVLDVET